MLPGALRVAREHLLAGQQQDNLCGCYWAAICLRADGLEVTPSTSRSRPAHRSGGIPDDVHRARPGSTTGYLCRSRRGRRPDVGAGLVEAVARVSGGRRALVPLRAAWVQERVLAVLDLCRANPRWEAVPIANVRTGRFWGSRLPIGDALAWLAGNDVEASPPDWDVGHFVNLAGTWDGPSRSLVIVRDSYPAFGWDAHHLQPPEVLAAALRRDDGREGGVGLYVADEDASEVELVAKDRDFEVVSWDNGTPWPGPRKEQP
jgi:hypothetical protein